MLKYCKMVGEESEVSWVNYPGLNSSKYNQLAKKYLKKGSSGIVTFGLKVMKVQKKLLKAQKYLPTS